jgi:ATP-dependent RNA helicase DeaD
MTEQQQQHEDPSCAVDLSASALPEDKKEVDQEEVLTTTIESSTAEPSTTEASTTEVTADEAKSEPQSGFDGFGFSEALLKTLADKGYSDPHRSKRQRFRN